MLVLHGLRVSGFFGLLVVGILLCAIPGDKVKAIDDENRPLLNSSATPTNFGTVASNSSRSEEDDNDNEEDILNDDSKDIKEQQRKRLEEGGGWWGYLKGFSIFLPYLWPSNNLFLQSCVAITVLGLAVDRLLNFFTPLQVGIIVNRLTEYYRSIVLH